MSLRRSYDALIPISVPSPYGGRAISYGFLGVAVASTILFNSKLYKKLKNRKPVGLRSCGERKVLAGHFEAKESHDDHRLFQ